MKEMSNKVKLLNMLIMALIYFATVMCVSSVVFSWIKQKVKGEDEYLRLLSLFVHWCPQLEGQVCPADLVIPFHLLRASQLCAVGSVLILIFAAILTTLNQLDVELCRSPLLGRYLLPIVLAMCLVTSTTALLMFLQNDHKLGQIDLAIIPHLERNVSYTNRSATMHRSLTQGTTKLTPISVSVVVELKESASTQGISASSSSTTPATVTLTRPALKSVSRQKRLKPDSHRDEHLYVTTDMLVPIAEGNQRTVEYTFGAGFFFQIVSMSSTVVALLCSITEMALTLHNELSCVGGDA